MSGFVVVACCILLLWVGNLAVTWQFVVLIEVSGFSRALAKGLSEFQEDSFGFALVVQTGDTRKRVIDQVIELNKSALGVSGVDFGTNGISQIEGPALGSLFLFGPV